MEKMVVDNDLFFSDVLQVLAQGRQVTIPVKGFSMLPFIRGTKDLVILEKAGEDLKADDIVLFHVGPADGGRYVMHRILAIDGDKVDIMGDGVPYNHEHVFRNQILAKADGAVAEALCDYVNTWIEKDPQFVFQYLQLREGWRERYVSYLAGYFYYNDSADIVASEQKAKARCPSDMASWIASFYDEVKAQKE